MVHGVASPLLFKTFWRRLGHRGYEFLEFWCWNLVPFLPNKRFQLLKILWSFFDLMMHKMFSIGERSGLQAVQFSTRTLLLRSHAVVIAAVCGFSLSCRNTQGLPWNRRHLEGSICCSKTFIYTFQHSWCLPKHASCPYLKHICTHIPSEMLAFELNADDTLEGLTPL